MVHKNFGIKPKCCGKNMFIETSDDYAWFECSVGCEGILPIPEGYFDDTPEEFEPSQAVHQKGGE